MSSWLESVRSTIYPQVEAALSSVNHQLDSQVANRLTIRQFISAYDDWKAGGEIGPAPGLGTPFVVYDWGIVQPRQGRKPSARRYKQLDITIYYCTETRGKTADEFQAEMEGAMKALDTLFYQWNGPVFGVPAPGTANMSTENAANTMFLTYNMSFAACEFRVTVVGGDV